MKEVIAYVCEYCGGGLTMHAEEMEAHEAHCHMNPAKKQLICHRCTYYDRSCMVGTKPTRCNTCISFKQAGVVKTPAKCRTCVYAYINGCKTTIGCFDCPMYIMTSPVDSKESDARTLCRCGTIAIGAVCPYYKEIKR